MAKAHRDEALHDSSLLQQLQDMLQLLQTYDKVLAWPAAQQELRCAPFAASFALLTLLVITGALNSRNLRLCHSAVAVFGIKTKQEMLVSLVLMGLLNFMLHACRSWQSIHSQLNGNAAGLMRRLLTIDAAWAAGELLPKCQCPGDVSLQVCTLLLALQVFTILLAWICMHVKQVLGSLQVPSCWLYLMDPSTCSISGPSRLVFIYNEAVWQHVDLVHAQVHSQLVQRMLNVPEEESGGVLAVLRCATCSTATALVVYEVDAQRNGACSILPACACCIAGLRGIASRCRSTYS